MTDDPLRPLHEALSNRALARADACDPVWVGVANAAEAANAARLRRDLHEMGNSLPFRRDGRTPEQVLTDTWRLARLAGRRSGRAPSPDGSPTPVPSSCDPGWTGVIQPGDKVYNFGSGFAERAAVEVNPPIPHAGISGTSAHSKGINASITAGAALGEYCGLQWTPPDQRVPMGLYETSTISGSWSSAIVLGSELKTRAPNALMVKVPVTRGTLDANMVAGDPAGPSGGLIWCWARATLDVTIGLNLLGGLHLPHAETQVCLVNRMGSPFYDNVASNGVNGDWDTHVDVFDDGDVSQQVLTATIGGSGTADTIVFVTVSVDVCCLRRPGSDGFVSLDLRDPAMFDALVITPYETDYTLQHSAPVQIGTMAICGI